MENDGWVKLHRRIVESKIWETKSSSWVICWLYILLKVSFEDNSSYKKGQAHFRSVDKELLPFDITNRIWYSCISWLEQEGMIKRQKVWRGEIITVVNYEKYQSQVNHREIIETQKIIEPQGNFLEQKNATGKSDVNHREIIPPTNIDENKSENVLRIKEVKNKEEDLLQQSHSLDIEKDIEELFNKFGVSMNFKPSIGYRVANRDNAILLLKDHTVEDIIKAVEVGKKKYKKEGKDPSQFITLKSLINSIDIWLSKPETKIIKGGW